MAAAATTATATTAIGQWLQRQERQQQGQQQGQRMLQWQQRQQQQQREWQQSIGTAANVTTVAAPVADRQKSMGSSLGRDTRKSMATREKNCSITMSSQGGGEGRYWETEEGYRRKKHLNLSSPPTTIHGLILSQLFFFFFFQKKKKRKKTKVTTLSEPTKTANSAPAIFFNVSEPHPRFQRRH